MRQGYCCFGDVKKMLWAATEWRVQGQYTEVGKQANANYHCTTGTSERTKRWWRWNGPIRCFLETLLIGIGYVPFSHTYVGEPQLYLYHLYPSLREGWRLQNWWIFGKVPNGLWPPPSFSENYVALFATKLRQKCVCSLWRDCCVLYDPISHEMHVVQQFNMVLPLNWLKTYPKKTLLYHFHAEKALFRVQNLQKKFLGWKWPPPPLLELFRKFIRFGGAILPLLQNITFGKWLRYYVKLKTRDIWTN